MEVSEIVYFPHINVTRVKTTTTSFSYLDTPPVFHVIIHMSLIYSYFTMRSFFSFTCTWKTNDMSLYQRKKNMEKWIVVVVCFVLYRFYICLFLFYHHVCLFFMLFLLFQIHILSSGTITTADSGNIRKWYIALNELFLLMGGREGSSSSLCEISWVWSVGDQFN